MLKILGKWSSEEMAQLEAGVVEVSAKKMNRTALGIVHAMHLLYPNATFSELKSMLPDNVNPVAPVNFKSLFKPYTDRPYGVIQNGSIREECKKASLDVNASHFTAADETFRTVDGVEVLVARSWNGRDAESGKNDLQELINNVAAWGVRVVEIKQSQPFATGGFQLEVIHPEIVKKLTSGPKRNYGLAVIVAFFLMAAAVTFLFLKNYNAYGIGKVELLPR